MQILNHGSFINFVHFAKATYPVYLMCYHFVITDQMIPAVGYKTMNSQGITGLQISSSAVILQYKAHLTVFGFNDTSILMVHFVSSPREREKRVRRDNSRDESEVQGREENE